MKTQLNILKIKIEVDSNDEIAKWLNHDYNAYITEGIENPDLKFYLSQENPDYSKLPKLKAKVYHNDYIIYDSASLRIVDFLGKALNIYDTEKNEVRISAGNLEQLYEIFELAFESLLGEKLDKSGFHRIHGLALEKDDQATLLLLPPGAGKTTLALKFLNDPDIKVLTEDISLFKNNKLYGLHFRWGILEDKANLLNQTWETRSGTKKILVSTKNFNLAAAAKPGNLILGQRISSGESNIKKAAKIKLFWPLFKSMVLGLELQQSLAYFLLRNYKDGFSKIKIGFSRLFAIITLINQSNTYFFEIGNNIEKNYQNLKKFLV